MPEETAGRRSEPSGEVPSLDDSLRPGSSVEVRTRFDGQWVGGYELAGAGREGFKVRRRSDGYEIPRHFESDDVRLQD